MHNLSKGKKYTQSAGWILLNILWTMDSFQYRACTVFEKPANTIQHLISQILTTDKNIVDICLVKETRLLNHKLTIVENTDFRRKARYHKYSSITFARIETGIFWSTEASVQLLSYCNLKCPLICSLMSFPSLFLFIYLISSVILSLNRSVAEPFTIIAVMLPMR